MYMFEPVVSMRMCMNKSGIEDIGMCCKHKRSIRTFHKKLRTCCTANNTSSAREARCFVLCRFSECFSWVPSCLSNNFSIVTVGTGRSKSSILSSASAFSFVTKTIARWCCSQSLWSPRLCGHGFLDALRIVQNHGNGFFLSFKAPGLWLWKELHQRQYAASLPSFSQGYAHMYLAWCSGVRTCHKILSRCECEKHKMSSGGRLEPSCRLSSLVLLRLGHIVYQEQWTFGQNPYKQITWVKLLLQFAWFLSFCLAAESDLFWLRQMKRNELNLLFN